MIAPTIGRRIWYWPSVSKDILPTSENDSPVPLGMYRETVDQPLDAGVVYVWPDGSVSLFITDHSGHTFTRSCVRILADGEDAAEGCAQWMPYQQGQAKKAEASA